MRLEIHFLSDWHIASGIGDGHFADALLIRDANGLPYIPGRAVKGALREGARNLALCRELPFLAHAESYFFGSAHDAEESNVSGFLRVSDAHLPDAMATALQTVEESQREHIIKDMTMKRQHTALDKNGMVVKHSLHTIECGMAGMKLEAELDILPQAQVDNAWIEQYFACVCAAVKSIGGNRARGLGACRIHI